METFHHYGDYPYTEEEESKRRDEISTNYGKFFNTLMIISSNMLWIQMRCGMIKMKRVVFNYWIYEDYMMKVALMNLDYFMILKKLIGISF